MPKPLVLQERLSSYRRQPFFFSVNIYSQVRSHKEKILMPITHEKVIYSDLSENKLKLHDHSHGI